MLCSIRHIQLTFPVLSAILGFLTIIAAKPLDLGFPLIPIPTLGTAITFAENYLKTYSGDRINRIYHHDFTIAGVKYTSNNIVLRCELMDNTNNEIKTIQENLFKRKISIEIEVIGFDQMIEVMAKCQEADERKSMETIGSILVTAENLFLPRNSFLKNPLLMFRGIIPGTNWCGAGAIAKRYNDLGKDLDLDRCCRTHDFCPMKILAMTTRYGLKNEDSYTKSHCTCDAIFRLCLTKTIKFKSEATKTIFFNMLQVPCFTDGPEGYTYAKKEGHTLN